ncbi:MAG TPA: PilZ domain-containing protein [Terriglobales bacterium]|jgi:PilZ domain|nr:PilZ domain-containing protein [Terriglobales bacterium]
MAKGWKLLDWFREPKPSEDADPAPIEGTEEMLPPPEEEPPAFDLFPEESASGEKRSTDRRPLGVPGSLVSGSYTTPDPITLRDISPQGVYFFSAYRLAPGQLAEITLTEPDTQEHVTYHVKVVRSENTTTGQFGVAARITRREILGK